MLLICIILQFLLTLIFEINFEFDRKSYRPNLLNGRVYMYKSKKRKRQFSTKEILLGVTKQEKIRPEMKARDEL